jgi:hypothetical protein
VNKTNHAVIEQDFVINFKRDDLPGQGYHSARNKLAPGVAFSGSKIIASTRMAQGLCEAHLIAFQPQNLDVV